MWTREMQTVYKIAKQKKLKRENVDKNIISTWKKYDKKEYVEEYLYDIPEDFRSRLLSELGEENKEYVTPMTVAIMKNKPADEILEKSEELTDDEQSNTIPDYIYQF
ncbi:MAG: hypothetical protein HDR24_07300 [Lachnospiraceae bacterium]|nr:hypothetical protein [Lachnospiraceae bacterium]